ncbi:hypothetical protein H257_16663 [Aphanomyces astaci]|uniref:Uncharacterized protein n=1 Tax=Aphanomyces astaci TaxID=112090 RepID=W4FHZ9_APHAT|nr:hypothetical protein H257_16663 [Aphanomyces astaci]ETV67122.1 hypothetical protein H257_16663 [Aphanomyces astaci]|eukprot:XP_009843491.1 hypothetical protein H257_16663 [Aphanomyces astaci]
MTPRMGEELWRIKETMFTGDEDMHRAMGRVVVDNDQNNESVTHFDTSTATQGSASSTTVLPANFHDPTPTISMTT